MSTIFRIIGIFVLAQTIASCKQSNMKYDKSKWIELDEANSNELRDRMIYDLRKNHSTIGLSYKSVIDSLGLPNAVDSTQVKIIKYSMSTNWNGIDPISGTEYWIYFDSNLIAKSDSIYTWKSK